MGVRWVAASGKATIDGLLCGIAWDGAVTYSTPSRASDYESGYPGDYDKDGRAPPNDDFARLDASQKAVLHAMLNGTSVPGGGGFAVGGFTRLNVSYTGTGGAADLRVANADDWVTAYAYTPGDGVGGDVWLGGAGGAPRAGNYDNLTMLHEVGHALGLKHPHEIEREFGVLPRSCDSPEFTVMTYRPYVGGTTEGFRFEAWGAPQTFMMRDIAALQHLYGADFSANAGNTVYRWQPGSGTTVVDGHEVIVPGANRIFATIWDGNGKDTYDLSAYRSAVELDLRPGKASVFSEAQLADLGGGPNDGFARGNIFNALQYHGDRRSLIENAKGGSGDDLMVGNVAGNRLAGCGGDDRLQGLTGKDVLIGGKGDDVFVFGSVGHSRAGAGDRLLAGNGGDAFDAPGRGRGDLIDVHGVDADTTRGGNQDFVFGAGHGRGHLWVENRGDVSYVCGNVDRDAKVEFELAIHDGGVKASAYGADDFLL